MEILATLSEISVFIDGEKTTLPRMQNQYQTIRTNVAKLYSILENKSDHAKLFAQRCARALESLRSYLNALRQKAEFHRDEMTRIYNAGHYVTVTDSEGHSSTYYVYDTVAYQMQEMQLEQTLSRIQIGQELYIRYEPHCTSLQEYASITAPRTLAFTQELINETDKIMQNIEQEMLNNIVNLRKTEQLLRAYAFISQFEIPSAP